jgi:pSer/pThr/pTyr-binding forkhead associated (FHA) protein
MLTWPGGGFSLDEDILPHKKTVGLTWEQLLFEGARRADHGLNMPRSASPTITTAEPLSVRIHESQPRLLITRPDERESTFSLEAEYTHVGRTSNNEIPLPYPSVSGRHCIFIQSGPDVVLRDLNSSNGTYVNNELVDEVVLRPGDLIQIGIITMKFEPGVKRPKLSAPAAPPIVKESGYLKKQGTSGALYYQTAKLPNAPVRAPKSGSVKDDSAYVKGESAVSFDSIAQPEAKKKNPFVLYGVIAAVVVVLAAGACYYFLVIHK